MGEGTHGPAEDNFKPGVSVPIILNIPESLDVLECRLKLASSTLGWDVEGWNESTFEIIGKRKRLVRTSEREYFDLRDGNEVRMRVISYKTGKTDAVYVQRPAEGSNGWESPNYVEQRFRQLLGPNVWGYSANKK